MDATNLGQTDPEPIDDASVDEVYEGGDRRHLRSELSAAEWLAALMFIVSLCYLVWFPTTGALTSVEDNLQGAPNKAWFPVFWVACGLTIANFVVFFIQRKAGRVAMLLSIGLTVVSVGLLLDWWSRYHQFADAIKP